MRLANLLKNIQQTRFLIDFRLEKVYFWKGRGGERREIGKERKWFWKRRKERVVVRNRERRKERETKSLTERD